MHNCLSARPVALLAVARETELYITATRYVLEPYDNERSE